MGVDTRRTPRPPAATDDSTTDVGTTRDEDIPTSGLSGEEVGTELSRRTDQTHWSIPEDGSPIDIPIPKRRGERSKGELTRSSNKSQTSLLIEYFEGGKGPNVHTRPSVRVKVTPSAARKIKDTNERIRVSETKSSRKPSYTRRIPLNETSPKDRYITEGVDDESLSGSYTSAAEHSSLTHRHPPLEIEVMRGDGSDLSGASDPTLQQIASDVSSMPPDSLLEGARNKSIPHQSPNRSANASREVLASDTLKTPVRQRSRSVSREGLAHKAAEKVAKQREVSGGKVKRSSKTRSRSVSDDHVDSVEKHRRRSSRYHEGSDLVSGGESSLQTDSTLSPRRQSIDQHSQRSSVSKSSINTNARLLENVENAVRLLKSEFQAMKQEQKTQKNKSKFEAESLAASAAISQGAGEIQRKLSKHASAPDFSGKPKVVLNRDETNIGTVLSGDSIKGKKEHRRTRKSDSSHSERSFERGMSEETVVPDGSKSSRKRNKDGHRLRDAAAGGVAGGVLTAAALNYHDLKHSDSRSTLERRERRRRRSRSKSHSRSASLAETEEIFNKHDVPPMPMRSDIHSSDVTRDSLLSERTEAPSTETDDIRVAEVQPLTRGSPREIYSAASRTPTRSPGLQKTLAVHHGNSSRDDLTPRSNQSVSSLEDMHNSKTIGGPALGAAAGAGALAGHEFSTQSDDEDFEHEYRPVNRALSPIQSVSSRQESEVNRDSTYRPHSAQSGDSLKKPHRQGGSGTSTKSLASMEEMKFDHSRRPKGMSLETPEDVLDPYGLRESEFAESEDADRDLSPEEILEREHQKNNRLRNSLGHDQYPDSTVDYDRMVNYTDDSLDAPHLDRMTAAQEVQDGVGRNPDFRSTPVAVESAVASLLDPSNVSNRSKTGDKALADLRGDEQTRAFGESGPEEFRNVPSVKELQTRTSQQTDKQPSPLQANGSPRQSVARSVDEGSEHIPMVASGLPVADDPLPEIGVGLNSESDISTNPSIIQGPIGSQPKNTEHWPYQPTPTQPKGMFSPQSQHSSAHESLKAAAEGFLGTAAMASRNRDSQKELAQSRELSTRDDFKPTTGLNLDMNHDFGTNRQSYLKTQPIPSPPKDEGYVSGPGPHRGTFSPIKTFQEAESWSDGGYVPVDDPFVGMGHTRHMSTNSGLAHGTGSPLYDGATGEGLDRIQSKDIVALMDHLTVRDAQRNARDTEILVTLVRSAAEMRNSFEEMRKFIAEQDDILVEAGNKQHDRTIQKIIIGGPRPQPNSTGRSSQRASPDDEAEESATKKRNVFKRALKGLSGRNQGDISRLEDRLEQLLAEVQSLKNDPNIQLSATSLRNERSQSYHDVRTSIPERPASGGPTGATPPAQANYYSSNTPTRGPSAVRARELRQSAGNRVSTVLEADEELEDHEQEILDQHDQELLTPTRDRRRADSMPLGTPPQTHMPTGAQSNEHTPKTSTEKSRKHKSTSSSFGPKVSRWSRTTASSIGDHFRNGGRRDRPLSEASRSGELHAYEDGHYSPQGDDRLRSKESFANGNADTSARRDPEEEDDDDDLDDRPPSPLIPSQVSDNPKYQAVRNSVNLQHPQPRPGPTHRYQHQLESQAQHYSGSGSRSPVSPTSDTFGSDPALARYMPVPGQKRYSGHARTMSPISDAGYSEHSASEQVAAAPPRPPKVKDDGPLVPSTSPSGAGAGAGSSGAPPRPPKLATKDNRPTFASPLSNEHLPDQQQRYSGASASNEATRQSPSPHSTSSPPKQMTPQRKPTGPRPIVSSGTYKPRDSPDRLDVDRDIIVGSNRRSRYRGSPNPMDQPAGNQGGQDSAF